MYKYSFALLLSWTLIGCGSSHSPKQVTQSTTITGKAVDDLIVNGVVKVYPADNTATVLARGRTSLTNGTYTLNVSYDGVVVVEVTCDNDSQMLNPLTNIKTECAQNLALHSAAAVTPESGEIQVNVSPLTEGVVQRLETLGVNKENLFIASEEIKRMFDTDPLKDDPTQGTYSEIIAAFHEVAEETNKPITQVVQEVVEDLKDGDAGDSNTTKKLAEVMKEQNISNNIADNNGTFDPNSLPFDLSEFTDQRYYAVEKGSWAKLDFNATHMTYTNMQNTNEFDIDTYHVANGNLLFGDGMIVTREIKTPDYSVIKTSDNEEITLFKALAAARSKVIEMSGNFGESVADVASDSKGTHPGFELTTLTTTIKDNDLVIVVKGEGSIKNAIDTVVSTSGYANILRIGINDYYKFGLMHEGSYMYRDIRDENASVSGYSNTILKDGVELRVPLEVLDTLGDVITVMAEVGEVHEHDEHIYDKIETFVSKKTIPATAAMFAHRTFYTSWMEEDRTTYAKFEIDDHNITMTEQNGNDIGTEEGTYVIDNGVIIATVNSKEHRLTILDANAQSIMFWIEDDDGKNIEQWFLQKPAGFPSFVAGSGNHAPELELAFPPVTMAGVPLDMMKVVTINDIDQDTLTMGIMQKPVYGRVAVNGTEVDNGDTFAMDTITSIAYMPINDFNGTDTTEINVTDGFDTTTLMINITVLDKNNTLPISTNDLNGQTFYTSWLDEDDIQVYAKLDCNATAVTIYSIKEGISDEEIVPYTITGNGKILKVADMQMYLLKKALPKLLKFAVEYDTNKDAIYAGNDDDSSEIEVWYLQKPADFPAFE